MAKYLNNRSAGSKKRTGSTAQKRGAREDEELTGSYRSVAGKYAKKSEKKHKGVIVCCIAAALLVCVAVGVVWFLLGRDSAPARVPGGVVAAGVNIGGMTQQEAADALRSATQDTYAQQNMVIQVMDTTVELTAAQTGASLDADAAAAAACALTGGDMQVMDILPYLSLNTEAIRAETDSLSAQYTADFVQSAWRIEGEKPDKPTDEASQTLIVTVGAAGYGLDAQKLYTLVLEAYNANTFLVTADCAEQTPDPIDLDGIFAQNCVSAVDASYDAVSNTITQAADGYGFDLQQAHDALDAAQGGAELRFDLKRIEPAVKTDDLFPDELAAYESPYDESNANRSTNLRLACEAIDGKVLLPGEEFSYNATLGERTEEKGYKPAGAYVDGQTVDQVGGGICQVASTLYYCTLVADLEILERECHMFMPSYVPPGMDATINWGTLDFSFRNNYNMPIRISAQASGGNIRIRLTGTDAKNYYVTMKYETLAVDPYQTVYKDFSPDNPDGYRDGETVITPYTGYYIETFMCKYDKQTGELLSREHEAYSEYDRRDEVICRIVSGGTQPTQPEQETDPPEILIGGGNSEAGGD